MNFSASYALKNIAVISLFTLVAVSVRADTDPVLPTENDFSQTNIDLAHISDGDTVTLVAGNPQLSTDETVSAAGETVAASALPVGFYPGQIGSERNVNFLVAPPPPALAANLTLREITAVAEPEKPVDLAGQFHIANVEFDTANQITVYFANIADPDGLKDATAFHIVPAVETADATQIEVRGATFDPSLGAVTLAVFGLPDQPGAEYRVIFMDTVSGDFTVPEPEISAPIPAAAPEPEVSAPAAPPAESAIDTPNQISLARGELIAFSAADLADPVSFRVTDTNENMPEIADAQIEIRGVTVDDSFVTLAVAGISAQPGEIFAVQISAGENTVTINLTQNELPEISAPENEPVDEFAEPEIAESADETENIPVAEPEPAAEIEDENIAEPATETELAPAENEAENVAEPEPVVEPELSEPAQ